jgi:hypothetical protein
MALISQETVVIELARDMISRSSFSAIACSSRGGELLSRLQSFVICKWSVHLPHPASGVKKEGQ